MHIAIHKSEDRGAINHGWLETKHSFSFASYYNPQRLGFGALKVFNDDVIHRGRGFDDHPHDNMEIVSIVLSGELRHADNSGGMATLRPGDVQIMSAGTGVVHSEFNNSHEEAVSLLQIWIEPREENLWPRHEEKHFDASSWKNTFFTLVSPDKETAPLLIHQDAWITRGEFSENNLFSYPLHKETSGVFLFVISGSIEIEGKIGNTGDSLEIEEGKIIEGKALRDSDILIVEVPL